MRLVDVTVDCLNCRTCVDALHLDKLTSKRKSKDMPRNDGRVLLERCNVFGGSDGVHVDCPEVLIKNSKILGAASRGMFVSDDCTVENVTIQHCGGYGMKTRGGVTRKGKNSIQAGPWDASPWNTGEDGMPGGMGGGFGDPYGMMGGGLGGFGMGGFSGFGMPGGGFGDFDDYSDVEFSEEDHMEGDDDGSDDGL